MLSDVQAADTADSLRGNTAREVQTKVGIAVTAIAVIRDGRAVSMGSDSGIYRGEGGDYFTTGEPKVWRQGGVLIGYSGGIRVQEMIKDEGSGNPREIRDYLRTRMVEMDGSPVRE